MRLNRGLSLGLSYDSTPRGGSPAPIINDCPPPYIVDGKTTVRTIGASWIGDPEHPKADTSVHVLVHEQRYMYDQPQSLQAEEVEMLMGYPAGSTSGRAATPIDRLRALSDSWNMRTSRMPIRFSRHATTHVDGPLPVDSLSSQSSGRSAKQALLAARAQGGPDAIVQLLATLTMEEQLRLLQLMKAPTSPVLYAGSVLDSGSSKHLHSQVQVTHSDDLTSISGFESNTKPTWTQGNGYLPLTACDTVTGQPRSFDVWDSDKLSTVTVTLDILSLGKLVPANWSFYFESADNLVAVTPDKQSRFRVELGDDDILRFPHELCSGMQSAPLPEILQHDLKLTDFSRRHRFFMQSVFLRL